jgi:hypothetical protein
MDGIPLAILTAGMSVTLFLAFTSDYTKQTRDFLLICVSVAFLSVWD